MHFSSEAYKKIKSILMCGLGILVLFSLFGCGKKYNYAYPEWVEQLGLFSRQHYKQNWYEEKVQEHLVYAHGIAEDSQALDELNEVITRHNEFVLNNPDYFEEDMEIRFSGGKGNRKFYQGHFFFTNKLSDYKAIGELGRQDDLTVRYFVIDNGFYDGEKVYHDYDGSFTGDIQVAWLNFGEYGCSGPLHEGYYEVLKLFPGMEDVVINSFNEVTEDDKRRICTLVKKYAPGAAVYLSTADGLEKMH